MATIQAPSSGNLPNTARLSAGQSGNGVSTHVVDRGGVTERPALLKITTTVGTIPSCTYAIEGSPDGQSWFPVAYSDSPQPDKVSVGAFQLTTATTIYKILPPGHPWRYLRIIYSANINILNTADIWIF